MNSPTNRDLLLEMIFAQLTDEQIALEYEARQIIGAKPYATRFAAVAVDDDLGFFNKTVEDVDSGSMFNVLRSQMGEGSQEVFDDILEEAAQRFEAKQTIGENL